MHAALARAAPAADETVPCTLRGFLFYFLRLGTLGFDGPIALAGYMQRDLVERRRWISKEDYVEGLALAQSAPGPAVITVAFIGYLVAGPVGATLAAIGVFLPCYSSWSSRRGTSGVPHRIRR